MENLKLKNIRSDGANDIFLLQEEFADKKWFTHRDIYSILYACENDRVIGLYDNYDLVAYSIYSLACEFDKKYLPPNLKDNKVGKFSGTVVSCSYKGMGIQRYFLNNHIEYSKDNDIDHVMAYVHSDNDFSKNNISKIGLSKISNSFIEHKNEYRDIFLMKINS